MGIGNGRFQRLGEKLVGLLAQRLGARVALMNERGELIARP